MRAPFQQFGVYATLLLSCLSGVVHSFPTPENLAKLAAKSDVTPEQWQEAIETIKKRQLVNNLAAPISVTGNNAFQPPNFANGDTRGPCTGLNALANHGYMSRDGAVGIIEAIVASNTVFGMGVDLATLLSFISTIDVGAPLGAKPGFSIGGPSAKMKNLLGGLLPGLLGGVTATPQGLNALHNVVEADASGTRDDIYVTGDCWSMNMTKFLQNYNSIPADGAWSMDDVAAMSAKRFDESVATNPWFYYGPYSGMFGRSGGYVFTGRLMSNHSVDYPRGGHLTRDVYASFWGVYKDSNGALVYKKGWEQIPANWYRIQGDFGLADLVLDIIDWCTKFPRLASIGGNTGTVNSFAGVGWADITGGVLDSTKLLQGNNLICFMLEVLQMGVPNQLATLYATLNTLLQGINPITGAITNLSCPIFSNLQLGGTDLLTGLMAKYPGASKAGVAL